MVNHLCAAVQSVAIREVAAVAPVIERGSEWLVLRVDQAEDERFGWVLAFTCRAPGCVCEAPEHISGRRFDERDGVRHSVTFRVEIVGAEAVSARSVLQRPCLGARESAEFVEARLQFECVQNRWIELDLRDGTD